MEARVQERHHFRFHCPHSPNCLQAGISPVLPELGFFFARNPAAGRKPGLSQRRIMLMAAVMRGPADSEFNPL